MCGWARLRVHMGEGQACAHSPFALQLIGKRLAAGAFLFERLQPSLSTSTNTAGFALPLPTQLPAMAGTAAWLSLCICHHFIMPSTIIIIPSYPWLIPTLPLPPPPHLVCTISHTSCRRAGAAVDGRERGRVAALPRLVGRIPAALRGGVATRGGPVCR